MTRDEAELILRPDDSLLALSGESLIRVYRAPDGTPYELRFAGTPQTLVSWRAYRDGEIVLPEADSFQPEPPDLPRPLF